jgi:hypothetical protein
LFPLDVSATIGEPALVRNGEGDCTWQRFFAFSTTIPSKDI